MLLTAETTDTHAPLFHLASITTEHSDNYLSKVDTTCNVLHKILLAPT